MTRKTRNDLLELLVLSNVLIRNGGSVSLHMERANKPVLEKSAAVIVDYAKKLGICNWVYGDIDECPVLLQTVSKYLDAKLYFPQEGLYVPASHQRSKENNIVFVRTCIGDADIAEIVNFRKDAGKEVTKAAVVALFDFREKLRNPEISVRSVYNGEDLLF